MTFKIAMDIISMEFDDCFRTRMFISNGNTGGVSSNLKASLKEVLLVIFPLKGEAFSLALGVY